MVWIHAQTRGITSDATTFDEVELATKQTQVANKAMTGLLPRGRRILPLIPDFTKPKIFSIAGNKLLQTQVPGTRVPDSCGLPLGSKLISYVLQISSGERERGHNLNEKSFEDCRYGDISNSR